MKIRSVFSFLIVMLCFGASAQNNNNFILPIATGDTLYGTLVSPKLQVKPNVVLIIAGSGPTDRDCNSLMGLRSDAFKMLADSLSTAGIASLRYDKRGVGDSKIKNQDESSVRFEDFVDDAVLLLRKLKSTQQFGKIFIAGHSEGALIGLLAAQREAVDGYISIAGAGENIGDVLSRQIRSSAPQMAAAADSIILQLKKGNRCSVTDPGLAAVFRESVQPFLIGWMKYSPDKEMAKLSIPVLILQGSTDLQVSVQDAERLRQANPKAKFYIIDGMNHILKFAPKDRTENFATYYKPELPIDSDLCAAIIQFCR